MSKIEDVKVLVESGKVAQVGAVVQEALDAGNQPQDILDRWVWLAKSFQPVSSLFPKC